MRKTKSKVNFIWIKSFVLIITVILLVLAIVSTWIINTFTEEVVGLNHDLTLVVQQNIDTRLKEIEKISLIMELHPTNFELRKATTLADLDDGRIYEFNNQVKNYKLSNKFISNIYIYYPKIDFILGDLGSFPSKSYYLLYNGLSEEGYSKWIDNLYKGNNRGYYFGEKANEQTLYSSHPLPYNNAEKKDAILVVEINKDEVLNVLNISGDINKKSYTTLINHSEQPYEYLGYDENINFLEDMPEDYLVEDGIFEYNQNFIITQTSQHQNMKYITVLESRDILAQTRTVRYITYISILICLIFGTYISIYIIKKNNIPLFGILDKILKNEPETDKSNIDEYSIIHQKIDKMIGQNLKNHERLGEQQTIIERLFLSNLLSSEQKSDLIIFASSQHFDLVFEHPFYQVMLVRWTSQQKENYDLEKQLLMILKELRQLHPDMYIIGTKYNGDFVFLFNIDDQYNSQKMREVALSIHSMLSDMGEFSIGLGGIDDTMSSIVVSYNQAYAVVEMKNDGAQGIYIYDKKDLNSLSTEEQISNYMVEYTKNMIEENYGKAKELVDLLFNENMTLDRNTYIARCKKYSIINSLLEAVCKTAENYNDFDKDIYMDLLINHKSLYELKKNIHYILDMIILKVQCSTDRSGINAAEKAKKFIDHNYTDPMIGLYLISDQLGVSNTYLSTTFKDEYGIGIIQYINQLRIEHAKELITTTDMLIKDIAITVGFSSDVSFIRVFKQYEHTTPGKFKG